MLTVQRKLCGRLRRGFGSVHTRLRKLRSTKRACVAVCRTLHTARKQRHVVNKGLIIAAARGRRSPSPDASRRRRASALSTTSRREQGYSGRYCHRCGTVRDIDQVELRQGNSGGGAVLGAIIGGVIGNQFGRGSGRAAATAVGVVGGAAVGNNVEEGNARAAVRLCVALPRRTRRRALGHRHTVRKSGIPSGRPRFREPRSSRIHAALTNKHSSTTDTAA